jgi:hypothetical protein
MTGFRISIDDVNKLVMYAHLRQVKPELIAEARLQSFLETFCTEACSRETGGCSVLSTRAVRCRVVDFVQQFPETDSSVAERPKPAPEFENLLGRITVLDVPTEVARFRCPRVRQDSLFTTPLPRIP